MLCLCGGCSSSLDSGWRLQGECLWFAVARVSYRLKSLIMSEFHSQKRSRRRFQPRLRFHSRRASMKGDSVHSWSTTTSVTPSDKCPHTHTHTQASVSIPNLVLQWGHDCLAVTLGALTLPSGVRWHGRSELCRKKKFDEIWWWKSKKEAGHHNLILNTS